jgi:tRNA (adenine57-N1/adenine58-N1)-methyltransferase
LCTFSPCIEQTQRLCERLRCPGQRVTSESGDINGPETAAPDFIDIRTVEALSKYFVPVFKRSREESCSGEMLNNSAESCLAAETLRFKPATVSKGHSAYLTFARRRIHR